MPQQFRYDGQNWRDGANNVVQGSLANQLNDRALASKYGVDYDHISKSSDYQDNFKRFGTGFRIGRDFHPKSTVGHFGQGVVEGLGDYVAGGAQAITHGLKAVGLSDGTSADYFDALNKVREGEFQSSPTSQKVGRFTGDVAVPIPGAGKVKAVTTLGRLAEGGKVGAIAAAMMPTSGDGSYLAEKAGQATEGMLFGAPLHALAGRLGDAGKRAHAPSMADVRVAAGDRQKIPLAYAQVTDNGPTRMYADIMSNFPGGGALRSQARKTVQGFDQRVSDITSATGRTLERSELGDHIAKTFGDKGGFTSRFTDKADDNYNAVTREVHPTTQVDLSGTRKAMMDTLEAFPSNPQLGQALANSKLRTFAEALTDAKGDTKPLFFNEAQRLRSEVGKMLGSPQLVNDIPRRELAQVYGALSDDMAKSLVDQPKALKAFSHATRYYKAGIQRVHDVIEPLLQGNKTESLVDRLGRIVRDNAKQARTLRRSSTPEEWDTISSSIFHELGKETPGAQGSTAAGVSIPKFLTDFNKLRGNTKAYDFAFGGTRYAELRSAYGDLAEIADSVKHSVKMSNPSRSGYTAGAVGLASALLTNPALAFKAVAANYALSRALASPRFARWMVKMGRIVRKAKQGNGKAAEVLMNAHVAKLPAIAASDSDVSQGIGHVYDYFLTGNTDQEAK